MKAKRSFLSVLLALCMMFMLVPMTAYAADPAYFEVTVGSSVTQHATAEEAYEKVEELLPDGGEATIKLLDNYTGSGIVVKANKNLSLTFDLNGKTWKVEEPLVGSPGTETNAFQLNRGNTVTFQNGAVTSSVARIIFQNYCDLTVDNVDITLTTATLGSYAMSNNNASTVIKGGSTIEVTTEGNYAMDSFTFGDYTGGNVTIEDAEIKGDVEIANGGKLKLDGGVIDGDVTVYNYSYDSHSNDSALFTVESGVVNGDVSTEKLGATVFNGGEVTGEVTCEDNGTASVTVVGGVFGKLDENIKVTAADAAVITSGKDSKTVVGLSNINKALENAGEGVILQITKAAEGSKIVAPVGVVVKNNSGNTVLVNDEELAKDSSMTVEKKAEDNNKVDPAPKPNDGKDNPQTGNSSNLALPVIMLFLSGVGFVGTSIYLRKRRYGK